MIAFLFVIFCFDNVETAVQSLYYLPSFVKFFKISYSTVRKYNVNGINIKCDGYCSLIPS